MFDQLAPKLAAKDLTAVILAGGQGTRIRHLVPNVPKPMVSVLGKPFVEWIVRYLADQGIERVIISTGFKAEIVDNYFKAHPVKSVSIACVAENEPLGTAGGFLNAVRHSNEDPVAWLVLNGDSLVLADLEPLIEFLNEPGTSGALLGVSVPDAARFGTLQVSSSNDLLGFLEKRNGAGIINAGVYLFRPQVLDFFVDQSRLSFEVDVFPKLAANNAGIKVSISDAPFIDIGTPETLLLAEGFLRSANIPIHA
ncbi:MAG: putative nucleotidyl transferase [Verrucomicrobiales bacterium]|nr:putative nucleotidyl transferase [Verrucomicrobiales bacterium]